MAEAARAAPRMHPLGCSCGRCMPRVPADRPPVGCSFALTLALVGIVAGAALTIIADRIVAGPGPGVMIGRPGNFDER